MDTPRDLSKPLRTALIACIGLLVLTAPVVGQAGNVFDGFEDGQFTDDWTVVSGSWGTTQSDVFVGDYSAEITSDGEAYRQFPTSNPGGVSFAVQFSGGIEVIQIQDSGGSNAIACDVNGQGNGNFECNDAANNNILVYDNIQFDRYYIVEYANINYTDETYDAIIRSADGSVITRTDGITFESGSNVGTVDRIRLTGDAGAQYDNFADDSQVISGTVTDEDNDPIKNAVVNVEGGGQTQTNDVGQYSITVGSGEYTLEASKNGYRNQTKTVTVSGSGATVDFELTSLESSIELDTRSYLEHGTTAPYTVVVDNGSGRADVTDSSSLTVTSNDTSVVTVDTTNNEIVATSDTAVNERTYIEAEYTDPDGTVYTATQNVTVANKTVENLKILPTGPRLSASLGANADQDPTANTIPVIIVAMILGAGVTLFARSFAGLMAATLVITLGWIGGMVGNGMIIVTIMTAIMIGLNVATNVDYSVRR